MACEICGRQACMRCFHSQRAQDEFDAEQEKKLIESRNIIDWAISRISGTKPVAPHAFSIVARDLKTQERIKDARAAGLAEGIRLAREAVDVERTAYDGYFQEVFNDILAAIDAVKGE